MKNDWWMDIYFVVQLIQCKCFLSLRQYSFKSATSKEKILPFSFRFHFVQLSTKTRKSFYRNTLNAKKKTKNVKKERRKIL